MKLGTGIVMGERVGVVAWVLRNFWRSPCVCVSFSRQLHQAASDVSGWSHRKLQDTEDQEMKPQSYPFLHPYPHPDPRVPQRLWRSG
uniref:Predicted gene 826 n=1 Tax=Mus musculus TaxID=10090 RepID=A2A5Q3_MOUSE